ncbi:O-antigen ligase family protein [Terrabacter sp. Soil811]|uniref:O-antigen ligase family protein n=1 Tax=Terrabacter sp. Soil811 TaxID=1736419 RepID=UPI0009E6CE0C|nr:O-antigen ligase family protein [Terrabacter sp. Soil811]
MSIVPEGLLRPGWTDRLVRIGLVLAGLVLVAVVGRLAVTMPEAAVIVSVAVLAVGVTAVQPGLIPLAVLPLLLVVLRVGSGGVDLSLSDFALAAATIPALFLARRPFSAGLRAVLWASVVYQFATLITVVNNPYTANAVEWAHAWMLVSGSLLVGWAIGANGLARVGLRLLIGTIAVLAAITVVEGLVHVAQGDLTPVYPSFPYAMHKNFAGTVCALGAVMVYARPAWVGINRRWAFVLMGLMLTAVLLTQSRQAVIGLVAAVFVLVLRSRSDRRRSKLVLLLVAPLVLFVTNLVQDQVQSGNQFNSVFQRLTWFQDSMTVWSSDPWFGVGLRWWYTDRFPFQFQPPNAEIEVLTSAGVVGLAAFVLLMVVSLRVAWRMDPAFGSLAVAVLVSRIVQGQFDLFWSAVQGSLPFLVLGLCLGAQWCSEQRERGAARELSSPTGSRAVARLQASGAAR